MEKKLTLKQKDKIIRNVYKNYQRAQLDILYLNQHYNYYPQIDVFRIKESSVTYKKGDAAFLKQLERKQQLESFVNMINQIHSHLSKESYAFIENEYLNFYDSSWWFPFFSRASYYRMKHHALDEMLDCAKIFWNEEDLLKLL